MKILIKNNTAYTIKGGKLEELGCAETLEHIVGDVYKAPHGTYVIKEDKISLLSNNSSPLAIGDSDVLTIPEHIKNFKDAFTSNATLDTRVSEVYFSMLSEFSPSEYQWLQKHGVVLTCYCDSRLFVQNEASDYAEAQDVIQLKFEDRPGFIYHGGLYVRDLYSRYRKVPFTPIVSTKNYLVFYSGQDNLFALRQTGRHVKIVKLGALKQFFETPHGVVIEVEEEYINKYALYNLGKTIELICNRRYDEDFDLDLETGGISLYTTGFSNGYKVGKTENYVFSKGHYTKLFLI